LLNVFIYVYNEGPKIKIMEGWIDCRDCRNRYRAFIHFCPRCGSQNPYYAIIRARDRQNKRIFKKPIIIAALSIIFVVTAVMLMSGGFSRNYNKNVSTIMPNGIYIAKPKTRQLEEQEQKSTDLVQYALNKINEDRSKFNLPRVQLSNNAAAQIQAEDILKARDISHWTIDGMKPYMLYSIYNGSGGVSQNIAAESNYGSTINPYRAIDLAEWTMIYNDSLCCKDLHRQDILYKLHSHVSIGIAYNEHYFAIVENFENNYIHFNTPFIHDNETHVQISGQLPSYLSSNINLYGLDIYYDEVPTYVQYEKHKDDRSYELGRLVGFVFSPLDFNEWFEYIRSQIYSAIGISLSNYSPVPADKWHVDSRLIDINHPEKVRINIDIKFDISPLLKKAGVYTVVLYFEDEQKNLFPVTSYSIFANNRSLTK
jgi:hypothetical protein